MSALSSANPTVGGACPGSAAEGCPPRNISQWEQKLSLWGGAGLLVAGIAQGRMGGIVMSLAGAAAMYRGWTGHCHAYEALGINSAEHPDTTTIPVQQGVKGKNASSTTVSQAS